MRLLLCFCFTLISVAFAQSFDLDALIKDVHKNQILPGADYCGTKEDAKKIENWPCRIYLATFPRSGNHWIRYLIEEATHVATSSVYDDPDPPHLEKVFPWGGYCCKGGYKGVCRYPEKDEAVLIKTHFPSMFRSYFDGLPFKKAIRIIRHPIDSFYSLYLWDQKYRHPGEPIEQKIPEKNLTNYIQAWKRYMEYWDSVDNVVTVRYEDLCMNPKKYLKTILSETGYRFDIEDISRAVGKFPAIQNQFLKHIDHFTVQNLEAIRSEMSELMARHGYELNKINL